MTQPRVVLVTMDLQAGTSTFARSDAKEATFDSGFTVEPSSQLARIQYSPPLHAVLITTVLGDEVALPLMTSSNPGTLGGRPVVYLDQAQWSALARIDDGQDLPEPEEDQAARQLMAWAEARRVVLPISSGHCVETTEWSLNERRYRLGLTLMRLSLGWQMRHPLDVERDEILTSLTDYVGSRHQSPAVFSGAPATLTAEPERGAFEPAGDLPPDYQELTESLVHTSVTFDLLTDGAPIERERMSAWREAQQEFSDHLDTAAATSTEKRQLVLAFFLSDISHALARAAGTLDLTDDEVSQWLEDRFVRDLPATPYLGLRCEFLTGKHLNRGARWYDNDLVDKMYLCEAAAYADVVICESSAASHICQAQKRLGRAQNAVSKFAAGVELLRGRGLDDEAARDATAS
jgi:hypothetical protein